MTVADCWTTTWAMEAAGPLWYLRAYLWFVLLSPLLLRAFRRLPWVTLLAPLALTAVVGTGLVTRPRRDGRGRDRLRRVRLLLAAGLRTSRRAAAAHARATPWSLAAPVAMARRTCGGRAAIPGEDGWDLNDIPLGQALWSFGFCLLLLRISPVLAPPARVRCAAWTAGHAGQLPCRHALPVAPAGADRDGAAASTCCGASRRR